MYLAYSRPRSINSKAEEMREGEGGGMAGQTEEERKKSNNSTKVGTTAVRGGWPPGGEGPC